MTLHSTVRERLGAALSGVVEDYDRRRPPFGRGTGIEAPPTERIDTDRETALFLTLTTAIDRRRDVDGHHARFDRLREEAPWIFDPAALVGEERFGDLLALFEREGVRFYQADAKTWYEISRTLYLYYDGDPTTLFGAHDHRLADVERQVVEASGDTVFYRRNFPKLRDDRTRRSWLRLIDDRVHPLDGIDRSIVPVDARVARFTGRLLGEEFSTTGADRKRVRRFWRRVCEGRPIRPIDVDGPIRSLSLEWEAWGRRYLQGALHDAGLELDAAGGVATGRARGSG